ncbi:MAG: L-2-amino-thiazoline-4-carboxylic acid hydrolase [Hyphomicrobiales bacterium]|nr:L-2-amino-thiazoline-4-carboxylic acid hydrolase [Hyphomicrobiales bacterium]
MTDASASEGADRRASFASASTPTSVLPMIERRRIEAEILKEVYDTLKESHGVGTAKATIAEAVRRSSKAQAKRFADEARAKEGQTSMASFLALRPLWTMNGALEIEMIEETPSRLAYNVTRCRYAEMYRAMGLGEIGHLLSCQRDGTFCEGYDERLKLTRTQTLMQGASHCDFRYVYEGKEGTGDM